MTGTSTFAPRVVWALVAGLAVGLSVSQAEEVPEFPLYPAYDQLLDFLEGLSVLQAEEVPEFPFYPPYDELLDFLEDDNPIAKKCNLSELFSDGEPLLTSDGRPLMAVKISDNCACDVDEDEPDLLFIGAIHGRQPLGVRVLLKLIEDLTEQYESDPQVQDWVNAYEIWIVPVMNPFGYDNIQRKNGPNTGDPDTSGVDLNRNFDFRWDQCPPDCDDPNDSRYRGPSPLSEPETQLLDNLVREQKPVFGTVFHSGVGGADGLFLVPWDPPAQEPVDSDRIFDVGRVIRDAIFQSRNAGFLCDDPEPIPGACSKLEINEGAAYGQDFNYYYAVTGMFHYLIETNGDLDGNNVVDNSEIWIDDFFYEDDPHLTPEEEDHFDDAKEYARNFLDGIKGLLDHFLCDTDGGFSFTGPGVTGRVFDHDGSPLAATIKVLTSDDTFHDDDIDNDGDVDEDDLDVDFDLDADLEFRTADPGFGRYLRLLVEGIYTLEFSLAPHPTVTREVDVTSGCLLELDVYLQHPPVADAGPDQVLECSSLDGAPVVLDGSGSTDEDSTPSTNDDIVLFEWFENFGVAGEELLGTGEVLPITLSLGSHVVTLRVTDLRRETDTDDVLIAVVDSTPPTIVELDLDPDLLWPPNHQLVDVVAKVTVEDDCDEAPTILLTSITSDEPDDAPGSGDGHTVNDIQDAELGTADFNFRLRAERMGSGRGRTYTVTYTATDASGNEASASATVFVPHEQRG